MYWHYKKQIRNTFWAFIILTHPSVLQELDFIIYTRGGGSWCFRPRLRGGLANFTPIARMGHLISKSKFKIPTPPHLLISDKSLKHKLILCQRMNQNFWHTCKMVIVPLAVCLCKPYLVEETCYKSQRCCSLYWGIPDRAQSFGSQIVTE